MKIKVANQIFLLGAISVVAIGILFGAEATVIAMVAAVVLLVVLVVVDGWFVCGQALRQGKTTDALLTAMAYLAGIIVLLTGLRGLLDPAGANTAGHKSSRLIGSALVLLIFVFFVGLIREGSSSLNDNLRGKRYAMAFLNLAVLVGGAVVVLAGVWQLARIFFL